MSLIFEYCGDGNSTGSGSRGSQPPAIMVDVVIGMVVAVMVVTGMQRG